MLCVLLFSILLALAAGSPLPGLQLPQLPVQAAGQLPMQAAGQPAADYLVQPLRCARPPGIEMYVAEVHLGTPPQPMTVSFETVSDLSYVPSQSCHDAICLAHRQYDSTASSTYETDGTPFEVRTSTNISGLLSRDALHLAGVSAPNQTFGEATSMVGPNYAQYLPNDGSFGLGLRGPLLDGLQEQGLIQQRVFGIYLGGQEGELTLGGINDAHHSGDIAYLDVIPDQDFWTVRLDNISVEGGADLDLCGSDGCPGVFLTSSPYFSTSMERAQQIADAVGAEPLASPGAYAVDCTLLHELPTMTVTVAGRAVSLSGSEYTLVSHVGGNLQLCVLGVIGSPDMQDNWWTLGTFFMQKVFTVFDKENGRIGFADSRH